MFYVFGAVGCLWSAAWFVVGDSSPSTHPRISRSELRYWELESGMMQLVVRPPTPWRKLLTSLPVWALAVAFFAADRGLFTLVGCVPLFMHDVLGFDMTSNGALSAVPFIAAVLVIPLSWLADWLRSPGRLSTNVVRKVFLLCACMLVLVGYTGCDRALAVAIMFLAVACSVVATVPVVLSNQFDLAPLHAGQVMGLTQWRI